MNFLKPVILSLSIFVAAQVPFSYAATEWVNPVQEKNLLSQAVPNEMAHQGGMHGKRHSDKAGKFWADLNLTEDQKARMKALKESKRQEFESFRSQFESILTPEQKAKLESLREAGHSKRDRHAHGNFLGQLNLTDAQKAQLEAMKESKKAQMEAFHQQMMSILTPEQQEKMKAKKEQFKNHRKMHRKGGAPEQGS